MSACPVLLTVDDDPSVPRARHCGTLDLVTGPEGTTFRVRLPLSSR